MKLRARSRLICLGNSVPAGGEFECACPDTAEVFLSRGYADLVTAKAATKKKSKKAETPPEPASE